MTTEADQDRPSTAKDELLERVEAERRAWLEIVAEVGRERMEEPGPMGEWSFRDLAAHLLGWRQRTIARLEAAGAGMPEPPPFWPADLAGDDDAINAWLHERDLGRGVDEILADVEDSYHRIARAIARLPDSTITDRHFDWLDGGTLAAADLFGHLHDEHEPSIRAWLASRGG